MAEIDRVIERQRERLKRRERQARRELAEAYIQIERRLANEIEKLADEIASDPEPTIGTVFRLQRYLSLYTQVREQMREYATTTVGPVVDRHRRAAAEQGIADAEQVMLTGMGPIPEGASVEAVFDRLDAQAVETIVGTTGSGPVRDILDTFGDASAERFRQTLITGMALGYNPRKIAAELKRTLGIDLTRATLIARTEINRAHRESSRASYLRNRHIVKGWVWRAACDARTCVTCWAMHGTEFDLDTPMGAHPACRCALIPKTVTWRELGYTTVPETSYTAEHGSDLFARADPETQRAVLGPRAYEAYRNGEVDITDFVKVTRSPQWGTTYTRGSLSYARTRHRS